MILEAGTLLLLLLFSLILYWIGLREREGMVGLLVMAMKMLVWVFNVSGIGGYLDCRIGFCSIGL